MKMTSSIRGGLLLTSACAVLAACSGSGSVENAGDTGDVTVVVGGGNGNTNVADGVLDFTVAPCADGSTEQTRTLNGVDVTTCELTGTRLTGTATIGGDGNVYTIAPGGSFFIGDNLIDNPTGTPGTLTILPGTILVGADSESTLVVSPGSQLIADGDQNNPIIMTSANDLLDADRASGDLTAQQAVNDGVSNGSATARGEWGGLVINGFAPINACLGQVGGTAACIKEGEGFSGNFGGTNPTDNSGTLDFVRVQYPGNLFSTTNELNGIAFQGVGNGTTVSNIQVHNSSDDGVEFFGGTVRVTNLVLTGNGDDSLDWTDGWIGSAQNVVIVHTDGDADNGFEGDNFGDDTDATPQSTPIITNYTIIGLPADPEGESDDGMELRAGTGGEFYNGIVADMGEKGLDYTPSGALAGPTLDSVFFGGNGENIDGDSDSDATDPSQILFNAGANNVKANANSLNGLFAGGAEQAVTPTTTADPRVVATNYIGAFPYGVQRIADSFLAGWTLQAPFPAAAEDACPEGTTPYQQTLAGAPTAAALSTATGFQRVCALDTTVTTDLRLRNDNLYVVNGPTFVGQDRGADPTNPNAGTLAGTLTIDAGVTLVGLTELSSLTISRGSQLFANGTAQAPVVMTADEEIFGTATPLDRGLWGGLIINGRAPINACIGQVGGTIDCVKEGEGFSGTFGGATPGDNSGVLNYLSVRYPGQLFTNTDELNGIAFQGVGSGTTVDFVEVFNSSDDGVEFFGGTVNASHLVLIGNGDDSLDWTDGWTGNVQFAIIGHTDGDADNGFEGDNFGDDTDATPQSTPTITNFTIVGLPADPEGESDDGLELKAGTGGEILNGIVVNMGEKGLDYTPAGSLAGPIVDGVTFAANGENVDGDADNDATDPAQAIFAAGPANQRLVANPLVGDSEGSAFNLIPGVAFVATAVTVDEDQDPNTANTFVQDVNYVGAVENDADNWYVGWTFGL